MVPGWCCRSSPRPWWPSCSSRSVRASSGRPTEWCTAIGRARTRCSPRSRPAFPMLLLAMALAISRELLARGTGAERAIVWVAAGGMLRASGVFPDDGRVRRARGDRWSGRRRRHRVPAGSPPRRGVRGAHHRQAPQRPDDARRPPVVGRRRGGVRAPAAQHQPEHRARTASRGRSGVTASADRRADAERHRLERDLHDGAQQQVVALKVKLGIARTIAQREEADEIVTASTALADETQQAVDALRAVAHGIYPPLLESEGLEAALRAVERTSPIDLTVSADRAWEDTAASPRRPSTSVCSRPSSGLGCRGRRR